MADGGWRMTTTGEKETNEAASVLFLSLFFFCFCAAKWPWIRRCPRRANGQTLHTALTWLAGEGGGARASHDGGNAMTLVLGRVFVCRGFKAT